MPALLDHEVPAADVISDEELATLALAADPDRAVDANAAPERLAYGATEPALPVGSGPRPWPAPGSRGSG